MEADWEQAAVYRINLSAQPMVNVQWSMFNGQLMSISYRGDCARLYAIIQNADGSISRRLVADNFYYGRPFLYGLWRLPEGCTSLELHILPLQPDAPIYLPREADKGAGEEVKEIKVVST